MRRSLLLLAAAAYAQAPNPPVVDPGSSTKAPSDAVVLFDGKNLEEWTHAGGQAAQWEVREGVLVCKSGTGDILTKRQFESAQIHLEFNAPYLPNVNGQARGNSGVYVQGRYEIQILDSFDNPTYAEGSAAAVYGQHAPLVNASRPPGQWQSYDFLFHAPQCDANGQVRRAATLSLLHNGVLVQDRVSIPTPTPGGDPAAMCKPGPLLLQDHFHPEVKETLLQFRNIWVRPLRESAPSVRGR